MSAKREKRLRRLEKGGSPGEDRDQETTMDATKPRKSLFKRLLEFLKKE